MLGNWLIFHDDWHLDKNKDNPNVTASTGGNHGEISLESQNSAVEGIINSVHFLIFIRICIIKSHICYFNFHGDFQELTNFFISCKFKKMKELHHISLRKWILVLLIETQMGQVLKKGSRFTEDSL